MIKPHSNVGNNFPISYYFLFLLPKNAFSRLCGVIAGLMLPAVILKPLIYLFIKAFEVDMSDAHLTVPQYSTFNAFFTRHLKDGARPIPSAHDVLVSPVDGTIGQFGTIENGLLIQAKDLEYTLADLFDDPVKAEAYEGGGYITIYLAPYNYHRIHSPVKGHVHHCSYIPGNLWTVSSVGVNNIPRLFAQNERIISYLETASGECAVVKVGATVVGKIKVCYHSIESNLFRAKRTGFPLQQPYFVDRGDELGLFELGSTVICCFKKGHVQWGKINNGDTVRLGKALGTLIGMDS